MIQRLTAGSAALLTLALGALLSACGAPADPLPSGVVTATGSIHSVPLSLERRGTHALAIDGKDRYLLEGGAVDFHAVEGKTVVITGTVEPNIDPKAPPLFVVTSLVPLHAEEERPVYLPQFGMGFSAPSSWGLSASGSSQRFVLADGSAVFSATREPYVANSASVPLLVGGKQAFRITSAFAMAVAVPTGDGNAVYLRSLVAKPTPETDAVFVRILTSVRFDGMPSSAAASSTPATGTGTAVSLPCGGAAGLLCPPGSFCSITDRVNNIGICKQPAKK